MRSPNGTLGPFGDARGGARGEGRGKGRGGLGRGAWIRGHAPRPLTPHPSPLAPLPVERRRIGRCSLMLAPLRFLFVPILGTLLAFVAFAAVSDPAPVGRLLPLVVQEG